VKPDSFHGVKVSPWDEVASESSLAGQPAAGKRPAKLAEAARRTGGVDSATRRYAGVSGHSTVI